MTGRDGVVGAAAALNGRVSFNRAIVQISGQSLVCDLEDFKIVAKENPQMLSLIASHEQALFAQAQQSAACNATHNLESRLARWLLRAADLRGGDELHLTQEYIAEMLGVRRTSVTVVARTLQQAGMIKYTRGRIKIMDHAALHDTACECYETVKLNYDAMFDPKALERRTKDDKLVGLFQLSTTVEVHGPASLPALLDVFVRTAIEYTGGKAMAAFYVPDAKGTTLHHVIGMPENYVRRVNGFPIGLQSLACGLAAAIHRPVITADVTKEPQWRPWLTLANEGDYRACWSFPVETATRKIVGTFAIYYKEPCEPTPRDLDVVNALTRTAADIIAQHRD